MEFLDFQPYLVLYRYKESPAGALLSYKLCTTLYECYQFISDNFHSWQFYFVSRNLEYYHFKNPDLVDNGD